MGDHRGETIGWLIGRIDGIENLLRKIAPKYRLIGSEIVTLRDEAVTAQRSVAEPSRPRDWASLPPIQRTAGSMPQVAAPARFASALPGTQGLPPIVQPLGHEVSALATPGLVVARTRAVEVTSGGAIPAPVQRRAARGSRAAVAVAASAGEAPADDHAAHEVTAPAAAPVPAAAPIRSMPTVSRSAVRVPDRPLTSAASAALPAAIQRAAAAAAASSSPLPQPAAGGMRRSPSTVQRTEAAAIAPGLSPAVAPPGRSGLGEPMTALPASARPITAPGPVISRSAGPMPMAAASLRAPVQRAAAGAPAPIALGPGSPAAVAASGPAGPSRLPDLPHLPVARQATATARTHAAATAPVAATTPAAPPEIRPIAGANPIRTSVALQREAADDLDDAPGDDALPSPWWAPPEAPTRAAQGLAAADGAAASIQRSSAGAGPASVPSSVAHPSRPAASGATAAAGRSGVQRIASQPSRASLPPLSLPHPAGRAAGPSGSASLADQPGISFPTRSIVGDAVVQTSPARSSGGMSTAGSTVQREDTNVPVATETPAPAPVPGSSVGPGGVTGGAGSGGPTGSGSSGHSERDLDELAQALFGRIRGRLRSDLIHDREAKGLTFDNV